MTPIYCLKWGTKYTAEHVNALARRVAKHSDAPFMCWTDNADGVECETWPLPGLALRGWWWKVWLFSLKKPFLFLDLDVVPIGDLSPLVDSPGALSIIKDPWQAGFNSSVFRTDGSLSRVWDAFRPDKDARRLHGDQDWITEQVPDAALWPADWCRSYKAHLRSTKAPGPDCRIVYFHGRPKPWDVSHDWMTDGP